MTSDGIELKTKTFFCDLRVEAEHRGADRLRPKKQATTRVYLTITNDPETPWKITEESSKIRKKYFGERTRRIHKENHAPCFLTRHVIEMK
jgi:Txe/YoeB family toxin of Txe-Axe toxin-antitoxin module